ncbi:MAG: diacylglycerol kinase family protein [Brachybacterium sp.]|nr:diacylglycerol kinase family protein [Brachybacterium sp.]
MTRLRVGLLANPTAASGAAHRIGRQVAHLLRLSGISVVDVSGPNAPIARARARELRDDLTALVVVGGDGTVALGAEIVAETPVRLGVVAAGSGNDFARALRLPVDDPEASVRNLLHALSRPVLTLDAIEVTSGLDHGPRQRSVVLGNLSLGFDALVNERANSGRGGLSRRYTIAVARELRRFGPLPYWLEIDGGERHELDASLVTLCNTGWFGGGMQLSPHSRVEDGVLELVTLEDLGRSQLVRYLPRVFGGRHTDVPGFSVRPVHSIAVGLRDGRDLRAYADGEPRARLPLQARVLPGAVRILGEPSPHREEPVR